MAISRTVIRRNRRGVLAFVVLSAFGLSAPAAADPLAALLGLYEGVRTHQIDGRLAMLYGKPMTPGASIEDAAERFWTEHGIVFRGTSPELERRWAARLDENRTVIAYHQTIRGVPVVGANARIIVNQRGGVPRVSYVAARIAGEPVLGSEQPIITAELAALWVQSRPGFGTLQVVSPPRAVVLLAEGERGDAWAWEVRTRRVDTQFSEPRTFYVNNADFQILKVREDWYHAKGDNELEGNVSGMATPGTRPHIPASEPSPNAPVPQSLPFVRVAWSEQGQGVWTDDKSTDRWGGFWFNVGSNTDVDLRFSLGPTTGESGPHFAIVDVDGANDFCTWNGESTVFEAPAQAPGTATITNSDDDEFTVARMTAAVQVAKARNYILDRADVDVELLPGTLRVIVNLNPLTIGVTPLALYSACTGTDGVRTIAFAHSVESTYGFVWNTAFSSLIAHEFGHYVLDALISAPGGGFGEGFSDV